VKPLAGLIRYFRLILLGHKLPASPWRVGRPLSPCLRVETFPCFKRIARVPRAARHAARPLPERGPPISALAPACWSVALDSRSPSDPYVALSPPRTQRYRPPISSNCRSYRKVLHGTVAARPRFFRACSPVNSANCFQLSATATSPNAHNDLAAFSRPPASPKPLDSPYTQIERW
jgi:hypothetical protein